MNLQTRCRLLLGSLGFALLCHWAVAETQQCLSASSSRAVQITFGPRAELGPALSPDGKWLAFEYFHPGPGIIPQIWIIDREMGQKSAKPVIDNQNYNSWPDWSPDSQWISFMSHDMHEHGVQTSQIYKVRVKERTIVQLTHFPEGTALRDSTSWSRDGRIAFVYDDSIYVVNDAGGEQNELINLKPWLSPGSLWGAVWSPDGLHLAFKGTPLGSAEHDQRIWVADSSGQHVVQVTEGPMDDVPSWLDNDHILFERWSKTGEIRIYVVCLRTLRVECLTRGHIDQTPAADPKGRDFFFARGKLSKKNIHTWLPETHIWAVHIRRPPTK